MWCASLQRSESLSNAGRKPEVPDKAVFQALSSPIRPQFQFEWQLSAQALGAWLRVLSESSYTSEICRAEQMWDLGIPKQLVPILATLAAPCPLYLSSLNDRIYPLRKRTTSWFSDPAGPGRLPSSSAALQYGCW